MESEIENTEFKIIDNPPQSPFSKGGLRGIRELKIL